MGLNGNLYSILIRSHQLRSRVRLFATPWIAARQASLSITNSRSSHKLTSIESVTPSSHLILCCPLLLLPPIPPASESFPMSQLFARGGQSTAVSALASFLNSLFQNRKFNKIEVVIHSTLNSSNLWLAWDFPGGSDGKASAYNEGDLGSIPGSGRSPGEGNGNPLQYSCLENPMDREAW